MLPGEDELLERGAHRRQEEVIRCHETPTDNDKFKIKKVHQRRDADAQPVTDTFKKPLGGGVAAARRRVYDVAGHPPRTGELRKGAVRISRHSFLRIAFESGTGCHSFQAADIPASASLAAMRIYDQVPQLGRDPGLSSVDLSVEDQTPANTGADRDENHVAGRVTRVHLGPRGSIGVIVHDGRQVSRALN